MKLVTSAKVTMLAVEKKEASGNYGESFKVAVMQGAEVGTFSCTKEVFEVLKDAEMYKPYMVNLQIGEFKGDTTLRIIGASVVK